jgi:hypothetical protein
MTALTYDGQRREGWWVAMRGNSPETEPDALIDHEAVLWRPGRGSERLVRNLGAMGRMLAPLGIVLALPAVALALALPFLMPALGAAWIAARLGINVIALAAAGGAALALLAVAAVPGLRRRLMAYLAALERFSGTIPQIVSVKAGEVAIVRQRTPAQSGSALASWRFAELEGPAVLVVRGGREVIWNGTRAGYEEWLRETDFASL